MSILNWLWNGAGSVAAVAAAIVLDPTGAVGAIVGTVVQQAGILSSVTSIFGFQVAPRVAVLEPFVGLIQGAAIVFGVIFALDQLDKVWDGLKQRVL